LQFIHVAWLLPKVLTVSSSSRMIEACASSRSRSAAPLKGARAANDDDFDRVFDDLFESE
jgi:hypothetical protein